MEEKPDPNPQKNQQTSPGSPYVGLLPFTEKDAEYFYGRESEVQNVATNLRASALTIFYGGSGVGKSSLLSAGVIPYLQKIAANSMLPGKPADFITILMREWANNPIEELKLRIKIAVEKAVKDNLIPLLGSAEIANASLALKDTSDLCAILGKWTETTKTDLLIIFDQFEDFFLHPEFFAGEGKFGEEFPKAINNRELPVNFMISLRADAIDKLDFFNGKIPNLMKNTLRLLALDRPATEEAIIMPLKRYNEKMKTSFHIEKGLVEKLLDDLRVDKVKFDTQGQANLNIVQAVVPTGESPTDSEPYHVETPYLQLVMVRLWDDEDTQKEQFLSLNTLNKKLKGVQTIVEKHLDKVMEQFSAEERELATEFIHFTVTRSGTKIPLSAADLTDLAELKESQRKEVEDILRRLSEGDNRIFKSVTNRRDPENKLYEVAHDALGPAILSWRKRENDIKQHRLALEEENEKRKKELAVLEAEREAELAQQNAKLKAEEDERKRQEQLLKIEKNNRKLGRQKAILINALIVIVAASIVSVGYSYYLTKEKIAEKFEKTSLDLKVDNDELANKTTVLETQNVDLQTNLDQKTVTATILKNSTIAEKYDAKGVAYKSLINLLLTLQTGNSESRKKAMNSIQSMAKNGTLPNEYRPLFEDSLRKIEVDSGNAQLRDETINVLQATYMKSVSTNQAVKAIIFIQYQTANQETNAKQLLDKLIAKGFTVPGKENVGIISTIKTTQLRYFHEGEKDLANDICKILGEFGINAKPVPILDSVTSTTVRPNQFELWFSSDDPINLN